MGLNMISLDDIFRFLRADSRTASKTGGASATTVPPLSPGGRDAAMQAARQALAPKQADESHLIIRQFGQDGRVLQRSEEWTHDGAGLKAVTEEVLVVTCTGELVEPKHIRVVCLICGGHDSVVSHCRCGVALCRRCFRPAPGDGSPLCPFCYQQAVATFNTWAAHDRLQSRQNSK